MVQVDLEVEGRGAGPRGSFLNMWDYAMRGAATGAGAAGTRCAGGGGVCPHFWGRPAKTSFGRLFSNPALYKMKNQIFYQNIIHEFSKYSILWIITPTYFFYIAQWINNKRVCDILSCLLRSMYVLHNLILYILHCLSRFSWHDMTLFLNKSNSSQ